MCTIGASAHLGSRLDYDVVNDKMVNIQAFDFGVTLRISFDKYDNWISINYLPQELKKEFSRFLWPTSLSSS